MLQPARDISNLLPNLQPPARVSIKGIERQTHQKSIRGSISAFGVPYSHSLVLGSNNSCGNLVNSSFFLVKSKYFDETYSGESLVFLLCLCLLWRIQIARYSERTCGRKLTCILYGRTSSPIPRVATLASITIYSMSRYSASTSFKCQKGLFRCR